MVLRQIQHSPSAHAVLVSRPRPHAIFPYCTCGGALTSIYISQLVTEDEYHVNVIYRVEADTHAYVHLWTESNLAMKCKRT